MVQTYIRLIRSTIVVAYFLPALVYFGGAYRASGGSAEFRMILLGLAALAAVLGLVTAWALGRLRPAIDALAADQATFLDRLPDRQVPWAIAASAAAALALELAVIRWQGTIWEVFAFYKNFSLLSCFAGLGLGYAMAGRDRIPSAMVLPLLAFQQVFLIALRYGLPAAVLGSLRSLPIAEQLNMGANNASGRALVAVYYFLGVVLLLTALAFIPLGQVCGRLLGRTAHLRGYGLNLLGSLAGVALMLGLSFAWTPPAIWFAPCFAAVVLLQASGRRPVLVGLLASLPALIALDWPVAPLSERIYSPYQLIERTNGDRGLTMIRAAGHFYQSIHDLSPGARRDHPDLVALANYYEIPGRLRPHPGRVAVVGAGTGNDVAAALRMGAGHVDAIEIDPAIVGVGRAYHPESPYEDDRVSVVVNDARTFLGATPSTYDLIVYGLLDSHTLLSQASSVRLDSFVYTVEGLRGARSHLKQGGVVSLSFCVLSPEIGRKIYLMMQEAFDGKPPICIWSRTNASVVFAQSKEGDLRADPAIFAEEGIEDRSGLYADPKILADVSTDDWPFFYMPRRIYPTSYIGMAVLILVLSALLFGSFARERPRLGSSSYFFMGAGFMLVETKGITELGLMFGNTWQVIGIVIAAILAMAYLANLVVAGLGLRRPVAPLLMLLASLGVGLAIARAGGLPATPVGKIAAVVVLTCPMFFSGIAFSSLLAGSGEIGAALAMNLLGAMCGGLLEYNSMYFGFQSLYWIAMGLYGSAIVGHLLTRPGPSPGQPA